MSTNQIILLINWKKWPKPNLVSIHEKKLKRECKRTTVHTCEQPGQAYFSVAILLSLNETCSAVGVAQWQESRRKPKPTLVISSDGASLSRDLSLVIQDCKSYKGRALYEPGTHGHTHTETWRHTTCSLRGTRLPQTCSQTQEGSPGWADQSMFLSLGWGSLLKQSRADRIEV